MVEVGGSSDGGHSVEDAKVLEKVESLWGSPLGLEQQVLAIEAVSEQGTMHS